MHAQIRTVPAASPADLKKFLQLLKDENIPAVALGGSDVEKGGEVSFGLVHAPGDEAPYVDAMAKLEKAGYHPRLVQVALHEFDAHPGGVLDALLDAIDTIRSQNPDNRIRDFAVETDANGLVQLQIVSDTLP